MSIKEKVEEKAKKILDALGVRHYGKNESVNSAIDKALKDADSKTGGSGNNYPDIKLLLDNGYARRVPVMIEAKGSKNRLEKLSKDGSILGVTLYDKDGPISKKTGSPTHLKGEQNYSFVSSYAINGALHYGNAILDEGTYSEVIIVGINGTKLNKLGDVTDFELKAYYVSEMNHRVPKHINSFDKHLTMLKSDNIETLYAKLDMLNLSEDEREKLRTKTEATLESRIKGIHQSIYENVELKSELTTNEKLYLFCGLIMAGLKTKGVAPLDVRDFKGNNDTENNDAALVLTQIRSFLKKKECSDDKIRMITGLLEPVFKKPKLWKPADGESILKLLYKQIKDEIIPCLESDLHLDFTGKILNSLNDWVSIENDRANDVVLTPRYITSFMARLARTNKDSFVWDRAMGSAGFLVSAMDIMIKDATEKISDKEELTNKIKDIKQKQLLGIEILGNIFILAILNMILMGDGSSNFILGDSHDESLGSGFPATVFLLNPPYSAAGKGLVFACEALSMMTSGYACILIQENAGAGQGDVYAKNILKSNTLLASIHMPIGLFMGKSSVQTAIYVFKAARPHEIDDIVTFIDFSEDGYSRQNRRKSNQAVNLQDTNNAIERYAEVEAIILGKKPKTNYYSEENGLIIRDCISLNGNDWTYNQHKRLDLTPTETDFYKTVGDLFRWKLNESTSIKSTCINSGKIEAPFARNFKVSDLFEGMTGDVDLQNKDIDGKGEYFINSGVQNQGVKGRTSRPARIFEAETITVDFLGNAYMRDFKFKLATHNHVFALKEKEEMPRNVKLYIVSILSKLASRYSFDNMLTLPVLYDTVIQLPCLSNGMPDYDFMSNYIAEIKERTLHSVQTTVNNMN